MVLLNLINPAAQGRFADAEPIVGQLRGDVQTTVKEIRQLAPGNYPPLLRDRWRAEATNPICSSKAPKASGCEVAYSTNSIPSIPSGLFGSGRLSWVVMIGLAIVMDSSLGERRTKIHPQK